MYFDFGLLLSCSLLVPRLLLLWFLYLYIHTDAEVWMALMKDIQLRPMDTPTTLIVNKEVDSLHSSQFNDFQMCLQYLRWRLNVKTNKFLTKEYQ